MKKKESNKENENNKESKFFIIVSLLTLIVMTFGATMAYYVSVIKSGDDDYDIKLASQAPHLTLSISALYNSKKIIPTNDLDIFTALEHECIDKYDFGACYAYNIEIVNDSIPQDITGLFKMELSENIQNMKYMFLDADNNNEIFQDIDSAPINFKEIGSSIHLESGESKKLILIIWLSNLDYSQDDETAGTFTGEFSVTSTGGRLTGTIAGVN